MPASVLPCVVRRRAAARWRLRASWATWFYLLRPFLLRATVTEDVATAPISIHVLAGGGGWEAPVGAAVLTTWVLSLGSMGMVPSKSVGLFVLSMVTSAGGVEAL